MTTTEPAPLRLLYQQDETAWLEAMSALAAEGQYAELDYANLSEYLGDMAKRDRREVFSRLVVFLKHLLKWECQPDRRSGSWKATLKEQRRELRGLLESGTLFNHAVAILAEAYDNAREEAADESELPLDTFPLSCPWDVEALLAASN